MHEKGREAIREDRLWHDDKYKVRGVGGEVTLVSEQRREDHTKASKKQSCNTKQKR